MNYDYLMKHSSKNQFYVYVYLDPRTRGQYDSITSHMLHLPFYVGKGKNNRYRYHLSVRNQHHPFYNKINKLRVCGLSPYTVILASFDNEEDAFDFEIRLISHYRASNINLTNIESGGANHNLSRLPNPHSQKKISKYRGVPRSDDTKQKIRNTKLQWHPTAKHWLVISPTGEEHRTKTLRQLIEYQLKFTNNNYKTLINTHLCGRNIVTRGAMKGWHIYSLS